MLFIARLRKSWVASSRRLCRETPHHLNAATPRLLRPCRRSSAAACAWRRRSSITGTGAGNENSSLPSKSASHPQSSLAAGASRPPDSRTLITGRKEGTRLSQARNFSRAEVRAGLEGFQERQRDRDKERVTQKDYCRMYSATLRDVAKKARAQQRAATSVPPGPSRVIPRSPQQTSPTIGAWPDGIAARHSA